MELLKFEIKKLLYGKTAMAAIAIMLCLIILTGVGEVAGYYYTNGTPKTVYEEFVPYIGVTANGYTLKQIRNKYNINLTTNNFSDGLHLRYLETFINMELYRYGKSSINPWYDEKAENPYSLSGILVLLNALEQNGKENTYEYRMRQMQYEMMVSAGGPKVYYTWFWSTQRKAFRDSALLFFIFILLILSPIFTQEYSSGMDSIILSSKNGRRRIVTAKILAGVVFSVIAIILLNVIQLIIYIIFGSASGWNPPLNSLYSFGLAPYKFSIAQYYIVQLLFQVAAGLVLAIVIALISSRLKSSMYTFFIGAIFIIYPPILEGMFKIKGPIYDLSIFHAIFTDNVFVKFKAFNFFGYPVLYPYVLIPFLFIVGILAACLIYKGFLRRDAC